MRTSANPCYFKFLLFLLGVAAPAAFAQDVAAPLSAWTEIETQAAAAPATGYSMYKAALRDRAVFKTYYTTYAGWKAPEIPVLPPGRLRNLADKPTAPRFPLTGKVWPAKPGEASVCLWADDKVAAVSFGIDDNLATEIPDWMEINQTYGGLNLTWNIITSNIGGMLEPGRAPLAGGWDTWAKMLADGFRVESHSVTHAADPVFEDGWPGPDWEAAESLLQIDTGLPGHRTTVFTPPGAALKAFNVSMNWRASVVKYYAAARGFSGPPINPANQIDYFDIRTTAAPSWFVEEVLPPNAPGWVVPLQLKNILNPDPDNRYYRGWATFFTHSLGSTRADLASSSSKETAALAKLFTFIKKNRDDLWVGFIGDVALYGQERDTATLSTTNVDASRITLTLTSQMDPARFNYPLTIKVRLPDAWQNAKATQDGKPVELTPLHYEGAAYALVKAVPDRGEIVLADAGR